MKSKQFDNPSKGSYTFEEATELTDYYSLAVDIIHYSNSHVKRINLAVIISQLVIIYSVLSFDLAGENQPLPCDSHINGSYTFEEAIELTGNGKFHLLLLWTTGFALLGSLMESQNIGLVLPLAKCELSLSNADQSAIGTITLVGVVVTSHFWGFLADTWGRRKTLLLSLGCSFACSTISSLSVSGTMLLTTRLLVGISISGVVAAAISYMGEFYSNRDRSRSLTFVALFMALMMFYQGVMSLFFMPLNWQFTAFGMVYRPWRAYIMFSSSIHAITFVSIAFLPESPKFMMVMGKPQEALVILKRVYRMNQGEQKKVFPVLEIAFEPIGSSAADVCGIIDFLQMLWLQTKPLLQKPHIGDMLLLGFLNSAMYFTSIGIYMWFPQIMSFYYKNREHSTTTCSVVYMGYNVSQRASLHLPKVKNDDTMSCHATGEPMTYYIIVIMGIAVAALISLTALCVKRTHTKHVLTACLLVGSVAAALLYWSSNYYVNIMLMCAIMSNAGFGCIFITHAGEMFPIQYKGMAISLILMVGRLGSVAGIYFVGAILYTHCELVFLVSIVYLAIAAPVCYYTMR